MTKNRPAEERRQEIIAAAERVIERDGIAAASTRNIANEAGCALSALHYVFPSKDDIFAAVILEQRREFDWIVSNEQGPTLDLAARVALICATSAADAIARPGYFIAQYELMTWALKTAPEGLPHSNAGFYIDQYQKYLSAAVEPGDPIDVHRLALLVLFVVEGIIVQTVNGVFGDEVDVAGYRRLAAGLIEAARAPMGTHAG